MTQKERVLEHLQSKRKLSQRQAINLYGAYRLAAIICELRKDGWLIETKTKTGKNRFGDNCWWAEYILKGVKDED